MECKNCGKDFKKLIEKQIFCSKKCTKKWHYNQRKLTKKKACVCKNCGKEFIPKAVDRITYCSRECAFEDKRAKPKPKVRPVCIICGKEFEGRPNSRYCSEECLKIKERQRTNEYYNSTRAARVVNSVVQKTCKHCGKKYDTNFMAGVREFCSDICSKKHGKRQRRARKRKQFVEDVGLAYIYQRDEGVCQLCGKKINLKHVSPHPQSATLDHIVPLSKGGLHEKKNVQLAHMICNSLKGNRGDVQPKLFG